MHHSNNHRPTKWRQFLARATKPVVGRKPSTAQALNHAASNRPDHSSLPSSHQSTGGQIRPPHASAPSDIPSFRVYVDDLPGDSASSSTIDLSAIPTPADYKQAASKRLDSVLAKRNDLDAMVKKSNDAAIQLYDQLQMAREDFKITDELLSSERQSTFVLQQRLIEAESRQQHLLASREEQEAISMRLSQELEQERHRMKKIQHDFGQLMSASEDAQKRYAKLREHFKSQQGTLKEALEHAAQLDHQVTAQNNELRGMVLLNTELSRLKSNEEASKRERSQLRRQLNHHELELTNAMGRLSDARAQVGRLEIEVKRLQEDLKAAEESKKSTEAHLLEASLELEKELAESQQAQTVLEGRLEVANQNVATCESRIATLVAELETCRKANNDAKQLQIDTELVLSTSQAQVQDLEMSYKQIKAQNEALSFELVHFKEQAQQRQDALQSQLQERQSRLQFFETHQADLTTARDVALAQLKQLQGVNHQLAIQLENSNAQHAQDFTALSKARDALQASLLDVQGRLKEVEKERDSIARKSAVDAQEAEQRHTELQSSLSFAENEVSRLKHSRMQELDELKRANESLADRLDELRGLRDMDTVNLRERIVELTRQVTAASKLHGHMLMQNQEMADRMAILRVGFEEEQNKLAQLNREMAGLRVELDVSQTQVRQVTVEKEDLERKLSEKLNEVMQNELDMASLRAAIQTAREEAARLSEDFESSQSARQAEAEARERAEDRVSQLELDKTDLEQQLLQVPVLKADNVKIQEELDHMTKLLEAAHTVEETLQSQLEEQRSQLKSLQNELSEERQNLAGAQDRLADMDKISAQRDALGQEVQNQAVKIFELQQIESALQEQVKMKEMLSNELDIVQAKLEAEAEALMAARRDLQVSQNSNLEIEKLLEDERKAASELVQKTAAHQETGRHLVSTAHEILQSCLKITDSPLKLVPASADTPLPTEPLAQLHEIMECMAQEMGKLHVTRQEDQRKAEEALRVAEEAEQRAMTAAKDVQASSQKTEDAVRRAEEAQQQATVAKEQAEEAMKQAAAAASEAEAQKAKALEQQALHEKKLKETEASGKHGKQLQVRHPPSSDSLTEVSSPSGRSDLHVSGPRPNLKGRLQNMSKEDPEMFHLFRQLAANSPGQMYRNTPYKPHPPPPWQTGGVPLPWDASPSDTEPLSPSNNPYQVISANLNGPQGLPPPSAHHYDPTKGWNKLQEQWGLGRL